MCSRYILKRNEFPTACAVWMIHARCATIHFPGGKCELGANRQTARLSKQSAARRLSEPADCYFIPHRYRRASELAILARAPESSPIFYTRLISACGTFCRLVLP